MLRSGRSLVIKQIRTFSNSNGASPRRHIPLGGSASIKKLWRVKARESNIRVTGGAQHWEQTKYNKLISVKAENYALMEERMMHRESIPTLDFLGLCSLFCLAELNDMFFF